MKSFGERELRKCLKRLGFTCQNPEARHSILYPPKGRKCTGKYPFLTVQSGRKTYDRNAQNRYITQIKKLGFTKKEIEKNL